MNSLAREQLLRLYRGVTGPIRSRIQQGLHQSRTMPTPVLFYHRVADQHPNGWTISRGDFARHLDYLQEHFEVVDLAEVQRRTELGSQRPAVAITFDDGYGENAEFAIPELVRRGLPATYFVATDFVNEQKPFPHDVEAGLPLRPNTVDELREFAEAGIEIGAHTRSHCNVGKLTTTESIEFEILGGARQLSEWLGNEIRFFAFPYGLPECMSQAAVSVLEENAFRGFCSAYGALNWPSNHADSRVEGRAFHIRRIHADPGIERLKNWLTLDPRKLHDKHALPFDESFRHLTPTDSEIEPTSAAVPVLV
ncbi:MAG: polysaccharide deacetylase family protein [Pirellulaceae bacterium]